MLDDIKEMMKKLDTRDWTSVSVEFGKDSLSILVPASCQILSMKNVQCLPDPATEIVKKISNPIGTPPLEEIIKQKGKDPKELKVSITVSDITRPVPYRGENDILGPILRQLNQSGVKKENVKIVIGTGMHRPNTEKEKGVLYGEDVVRGYSVINHLCDNKESLYQVGTTKSGGEVYVNSDFFFSDLRIATGLVESHFMVGVSGGRKAICPGLVDKKTIEKFHGVEFLESPKANNLILEGNPCHEESLEIARMVGVDFIVNVTLDKDMRTTGVFAGDLEKAHMAAFQFMKDYAAIEIDKEFDIVLTHGGYVGQNHYQTAKAACGAVPVVKKGGTLIVAADNRDIEPIGTREYRSMIHLLKLQGIEGYLKIIGNPDWKFTKDQWEPEVWGRVLRKVGEEGLIYCTHEISEEDYCLLPGVCGLDLLKRRKKKFSVKDAQEMVQNAVFRAVYQYLDKGIEPTMAFIREGPYAVPVLMPR